MKVSSGERIKELMKLNRRFIAIEIILVVLITHVVFITHEISQ